MDLEKLIYWISTLIACGIMIFSAQMYFLKTEMVEGFFQQLGYPSYLVIPLATLKVLGVIAIISRKSRMLKEWAYAGFFFDSVLAFSAHINVNDGQYLFSLIVMISTLVSYWFEKRNFG